jgi:hypothetical protein
LCSASPPSSRRGRSNPPTLACPRRARGPGKVVIDGKLDDWNLSGQTDVYANFKTRTTYSTKVAAMYDKDNFYLSVVWRDPRLRHTVVLSF